MTTEAAFGRTHGGHEDHWGLAQVPRRRLLASPFVNLVSFVIFGIFVIFVSFVVAREARLRGSSRVANVTWVIFVTLVIFETFVSFVAPREARLGG